MNVPERRMTLEEINEASILGELEELIIVLVLFVDEKFKELFKITEELQVLRERLQLDNEEKKNDN